MTNHETREIETTGRSECLTTVSAYIGAFIIVALSNAKHITVEQMKRTLEREFPHQNFFFNRFGGKGTIRADAERRPNDGV